MSYKILFADLDGVLNSINYYKSLFAQNILPDDRLDPQAIKLFNKIIDATGALIVVSSSWRLSYLNNLCGLQKLFADHNIHGSIIGMTPDNDLPRGLQIQQWLDESESIIDSFVIIDDDNDMCHLNDRLVKTCIKDGLTDDCVRMAIDILNS